MSKLEPKPPMSESSLMKVVHDLYLFSEEYDVHTENVVYFHF